MIRAWFYIGHMKYETNFSFQQKESSGGSSSTAVVFPFSLNKNVWIQTNLNQWGDVCVTYKIKSENTNCKFKKKNENYEPIKLVYMS